MANRNKSVDPGGNPDDYALQRELGPFNMPTSAKFPRLGISPREVSLSLSLIIYQIEGDGLSQPKSASSFRVDFLMPKVLTNEDTFHL